MHQLTSAPFPSSYSDPPPEASSSNPERPAIALNLGGINVSVGGSVGTGIYRTNSDAVNMNADGLKDGVKDLWGKVKQGVERLG